MSGPARENVLVSLAATAAANVAVDWGDESGGDSTMFDPSLDPNFPNFPNSDPPRPRGSEAVTWANGLSNHVVGKASNADQGHS